MKLKAGTRLIIIGTVILVVSMATLLFTASTIDFINYPFRSNLMQLSWFFIFFASVMIFMGIRRASPV